MDSSYTWCNSTRVTTFLSRRFIRDQTDKNKTSLSITTLNTYLINNREIIVYSRSIINAYSLLSHEWWVPLIKFIVGPTIHVRGGSTHL